MSPTQRILQYDDGQALTQALQGEFDAIVHQHGLGTITSLKGIKDAENIPVCKKRKVSSNVLSTEKGASLKQEIKGHKGLRHFSLKVCQKVEEKQRTTYNEVADDLVQELLIDNTDDEACQYDEKNIRRRVYDALNVLMAMDIISKEKKDIQWKGLPTQNQESVDLLLVEKTERLRNIAEKENRLQDLVLQQLGIRTLLHRNRQRIMSDIADDLPKMAIPFLIVSTEKETIIQCEMSESREDLFFDFSAPFEIHDENEILKRLGFMKISVGNMDMDMTWLPTELQSLVPSTTASSSSS